jgi:hypothetical protein
VLQVGASNELPESEELDALYDRFLFRRHVSRVSNNNVHQLARLASGRPMTLDAAGTSVCVCMCVCVCAHACVRACACACGRAPGLLLVYQIGCINKVVAADGMGWC